MGGAEGEEDGVDAAADGDKQSPFIDSSSAWTFVSLGAGDAEL
jgi:hypothetical protein